MSVRPYGINNFYEDPFSLSLITNSSNPQPFTEHTISNSIDFTFLLNNSLDQDEIHSDIHLLFREGSNIEQNETSDYTPEKPSEEQERILEKKRKLKISLITEEHSVSEVHSSEQLVEKTSVELVPSQKDSAQAIEQQRSNKRTQAWTPEEIESLQTAHSIVGDQWDIIQLCFPNRTIKEIKYKWRCQANPNISHESWTNGELAKLAVGYEKYCKIRNSWKVISKKVFNENRTAKQCCHAYKYHIKGKKFIQDGFDIVTSIHTSERPLLHSNIPYNAEAAFTTSVHPAAQLVDKTSVESLFGDQNLENAIAQQRPQKSKKKWTNEENKLLEMAHMIHENKWSEIKQLYLPDRTDDAIRRQCKRLLKPNNIDNLRTGE